MTKQKYRQQRCKLLAAAAGETCATPWLVKRCTCRQSHWDEPSLYTSTSRQDVGFTSVKWNHLCIAMLGSILRGWRKWRSLPEQAGFDVVWFPNTVIFLRSRRSIWRSGNYSESLRGVDLGKRPEWGNLEIEQGYHDLSPLPWNWYHRVIWESGVV